MRNEYKIFVRKPEEKGPLGGPGHGWEVKVKLSLCLTNHDLCTGGVEV
jgi:hypothetical protein